MSDTKLTSLDVETAGGLKVAGTAISATPAELNALDITAAGTVEASKAVVVDANKDAGDFRNLDCVNLDAGASGTAGSVDIFPGTGNNGKLIITVTDQGGAHNATLNMDAQAQACTVHIPNPGAVANSYLVQSTAAVTLAEADVLDGATAGTIVASKAVVADANTNIGVVKATQLHIGGTGAEVQVTATPAEINQLDGNPAGTHVFTIGAEAGQVINVGIQLKDIPGADLAVRGALLAYLSDDANGDSLCAAAPTGGSAIGTDGVLIPANPAFENALLLHGNLAIDGHPEKFQTTQAIVYMINGVSHTKAIVADLTFTAAHVITASKFGIILLQIDAAGTISSKVPASPQAYDDAPTALAALPAADAGNVAIGYIAIENNAGDWTANTDDMTNGSDVTTAAFTDSTETATTAPKAFHLISEADGDIDINITETGVKTYYLVLVLPNGKLLPSGAIAFT